jgi:hypothetical protein
MMGHGHASSGLCAGLVAGDILLLPPLAIVTLGACGAGAVVLSDIDCKGSTAATVFGPFSEVTHYGAVELHNVVSAAISHDDHPHGAHRGLTHWWPFWPVCGVAVWFVCTLSQWVVMGVLAVLFALAARGLTIPDLPAETQGRFDDSPRHALLMKIAYGMLNLCPFTLFMRRARKHVTKTKRYGWKWLGLRFGVGKVLTAGASAGAAYGLLIQGTAALLAPWLGLIVCLGMALHWVGDCGTHMGVPGLFLHQIWKLPFWASFYAGGPFEVIVMWFGLGWLNILLIPGLLSHAWQMTIMFWVGSGLGVVVILAIIIEATMGQNRRYV